MKLVVKILLIIVLLLIAGTLAAEHGQALSESGYRAARSELGIVVLEVNWGRRWDCAGYENAQLQKLEFRAGSTTGFTGRRLELETPSKLFVDDEYLPLAIMVEPGTYAITGFDVKTARSVSDIGHWIADESDLIEGGRAIGGSFKVGAGEIVYLGHFTLDCDDSVMPWRLYLGNREEFERYVARFREWHPYTADVDVEFRLFDTDRLGTPFVLRNPIVAGALGDDG